MQVPPIYDLLFPLPLLMSHLSPSSLMSHFTPTHRISHRLHFFQLKSLQYAGLCPPQSEYDANSENEGAQRHFLPDIHHGREEAAAAPGPHAEG